MTIVLENTNLEVLRVFIVRHGQTEYNRRKVLQGHIDVPLNSTGEEQARLVGVRLSEVHLDRIVCSDLTRCVQTAQPIMETNANPALRETFRTTPNLRERAMGPHIEGKTIVEAAAYARSQGVDDFREYGEELSEVTKRLTEEWQTVINTNGVQNVLLVTHGGVIRRWLPYIHRHLNYGLRSGLAPELLRVPHNTLLTVVDVNRTGTGGVIQMFGDISHLGEHQEAVDQDLR